MNEERFYELTTKFLSREIADEEKNELTIYLQIDQYKAKFENIVENWNNSTRESIRISSDKVFESLLSRIEQEGKREEDKNVFFRPILIKIAASIVFFALLITVYIYIGKSAPVKAPETEWQELVTTAGGKYELLLPDKSRIVVNGQSKIKYPLRFNGSTREVYLEGEAFFEIMPDSTRPFIVYTSNIYTKVLGTKFNICAFPLENCIEISLVEGKVKVINEKNGSENEAILLKPMQKLRYDPIASLSSIEDFDLQETTGWKDNNLKFTDVKFSAVLTKLERAFGIKFELSDKSYNDFKITGNFQQATYNTICEALKRLTKLQYKVIKENNEVKRIVFYKINESKNK